jgi:hypothetical protein
MKLRYLGIFGARAILSACVGCACIAYVCIGAQPAFAQETAATGSSEASLATGTAVYADLNSGLDSKKVKAGDEFTAHVTEALKSADGRTILPKGTKIVGHVVQASARAKGGNESILGISFDKATLKDGQEVPLNVAIQALAAPFSISAPSDLGTQPNVGTTQTSPMAGPRSGPPSQTGPQSGAGSENGPPRGEDSSSSLGPSSRGVYGLNGLKLGNAAGNGKAPVSVVTSDGKNVRLDAGTRMLLVEQAVASEAPGK